VLERYVFYVTPLFFLAFFAYAERGAPRRFAYGATACAGALALSLVSLPGLTGTAAFFFDSVTLSAFARVSYETGLADASLLYSLVPIGLALLAWALPLRRRGMPELFALTAIAISIASGTAVYATDRLVTGWTDRTFGAATPNWLDRSEVGPARYLVLPNSNPFLGTHLESWNRDLRGVVVLRTSPPDPFPVGVASIARDGTLEIGGKPAAAQTLVVNVSGSAIRIDGDVVARPREGLLAYRIPGGAHVHSLTRGVAPDGWTGQLLRYEAWPTRPGRYELKLAVPAGTPARTVHIGSRTFMVTAGSPQRITVPTTGRPLAMNVDVPSSPLGGRVLGVQVLELRFTARPRLP